MAGKVRKGLVDVGVKKELVKEQDLEELEKASLPARISPRSTIESSVAESASRAVKRCTAMCITRASRDEFLDV